MLYQAIQVQDADDSSGLTGSLPGFLIHPPQSGECLLAHPYQSEISTLSSHSGKGHRSPVHNHSFPSEYCAEGVHQDHEAYG